MKNIRLISSDLNGTLVHQHTMSDMIRVGFPHDPERFKKAKDAFNRQTDGLLSMEETFKLAGPLTRGLSLRSAVDYTLSDMQFLDGFDEFIRFLHKSDILFVINSTGYTVTTEVIKAVYGSEFFHDVICNRLLFERKGKIIEEKDLSDLIIRYVRGEKGGSIYDEITATGEVQIVIRNEDEKARLLFDIADSHKIPRSSLIHIGDTMGDSGGICEAARHGGIGIAFNYNDALKLHLEEIKKTETISGNILMISPKSSLSDLRSILYELSEFF